MCDFPFRKWDNLLSTGSEDERVQIGVSIGKSIYLIMRSATSTFSQQIIGGKLLLVVMSEQKSNFSCGFKLE